MSLRLLYGEEAAGKAASLEALLERSDSLAEELQAADQAIRAAAEALSESRRRLWW